MATITLQQTIDYARQAGFHGSGLIWAVAIARAESGLNPTIVSGQNNNGTRDYGLMQINSVHFGQNIGGIVVSPQTATDPAQAMRIAYYMSAQGTNFCPWCTYNSQCQNPCKPGSGPANLYVNAVSQAVSSNMTVTPSNPLFSPFVPSTPQAANAAQGNQGNIPVVSGVQDWLTQSFSGIGQLFTFLQPLWNWISNPVRIVKMVVGVLLIGVALVLLVSPDTSDAVSKVIPFA